MTSHGSCALCGATTSYYRQELHQWICGDHDLAVTTYTDTGFGNLVIEDETPRLSRAERRRQERASRKVKGQKR